MAYLALWLDHSEARVFRFNPEKTEIKHLENKHHSQHATSHKEGEKHENLKKFYNDVQKDIAGAKEILLMGPGLAKTEFKKYLADHHHQNLANAIVGVETCDKMSDGEVKKVAQKYFHKHNLFN